ncbi:MAG: MBL fold metallo-hydrolase [Candidatus Aminicenantes bacterium]|nr:MBL fold metallo-hydrolase [Candidatus Aminicenantes bacterium]
MLLKQFFVEKIAHSSYLLAGESTCAVVDPQRDVGLYLEAAGASGHKITHILETHLHADFISGHMDLAKATGAKIYAPKSAKCRFPHIAVAEGDRLRIEDMTLRVLETPGHTPEHISYVVTDTSRAREPVGVFCGDTLFIGDVGRPDLFPKIARELASKLYDSLHQKLMALPDFCEVYPAHGAGSLCGRAIGAKRQSTIGYERRFNAALRITDREEFIRSLTTDMPPAPDHFSRCSAVNAKGPALLSDMPPLERLDPAAFEKAAGRAAAVVVDARSYEAFGGQHVPGSLNIPFGGNFATFAGWVVPPEKDIYLVTEDGVEPEEVAVWLHRVGVDRIKGVLEGGLFAWARTGRHTGHVPQLSSRELHGKASGKARLAILDVRAAREYQAFHIKGAINIPAPDLRHRHRELHPEAPLVVICSTGHRSSLAASLLLRQGFKSVMNAAGGMTGYGAAGFAPLCTVCYVPHASHFMGKDMLVV